MLFFEKDQPACLPVRVSAVQSSAAVNVWNIVLQGLPVLAVKLCPFLAVPLGVVSLVCSLSDFLAVSSILAVLGHQLFPLLLSERLHTHTHTHTHYASENA
jgi:hypothetical protein